MEQIFLCILSLSVSGALIGVVLLLLHPLTKKWFSGKWNYYIWLLVVVRLLLPVHIETANGLQNETGFILPFEAIAQRNELEDGNESENGSKSEAENGFETANKFEGGSKITKVTPAASAAEAGAAVKTRNGDIKKVSGDVVNWLLILSIIWFAGAGISLFMKISRYRRFTASLIKSSRRIIDEGTNAVTRELEGRLRIKKAPAVYESGLAPVPITFGLWRPVVVLPEVEREPAQLSLILHHELVHVKRKDLWYKWVYQALLCIHWFNPILYLVGRKINIDCELACDEAVLACLTGEGRRAYGNILINTAERNLFFKENVPSTTLLERRKDLKERLKGILHYKKQRKLKVLLSVCMLLCLFYLSACGSVQVSEAAMPIQLSMGERDVNKEADKDERDDEEDSSWSSWFTNFFYDDYDNVDGFLAESWAGSNRRLGQEMYDDESMIAGEDGADQWRAYSYAGGGNQVTCRGFVLSGSDSILIVEVPEKMTLKVESSYELVKGEFKIVHVNPDKSVELIDDTGKKGQREITLEKGRNVIKMVGRNAKLKELSISFPGLKEQDFESIYNSEEEEYAGEAPEAIASGDIDKDKLMKALVYMEDEKASEVLAALLAKKVPLTDEELCYLIIHSDAELSGGYLADAAEKGDFIPDKETVAELIPYLESDSRGRLLGAVAKSLDWQTLCDCLPYLTDEETEECLLAYLESGNRISYTQFREISPYLNDEITGELDKYLEEK